MDSIYNRIQETMAQQQEWSSTSVGQQINQISNNQSGGPTDDAFMNDIGLKLIRRGGTT